jgi:protein tyrosine/serine phosphatase
MWLKRKSARAHLGALLIVASVVISNSPARAGTPAAADASAAAAQIHIDNFGQVDAAYYRGAQPEGRDYADLAALGIKSLINLTSDDTDPNERALAEDAGLRYFRIPMTTHQPPTAAQVATFLELVNDPANQPVYVHCVGGRHRTGVMTAAYRMTHNGWDAERAFAEMKQYKFGADFLHPEFKTFVYGYHATPAQAAPAASATAARGVPGN